MDWVFFALLAGTVQAAMYLSCLETSFFFWIFAAFYSICVKYLLSFLPFLTDRDARKETFAFFWSGPFFWRALVLEETFDFLGRLFSVFALALGPVSLVSAVGALQPTITLTYILALSLFLPGLLEEEASAFKYIVTISP